MKQKQHPLLIIEDSEEDFETLIRAIDKVKISEPIYRCEDGEEALEFLFHQGEYQDESLAPRPSLIILDLNLPGTDGREVLVEIKQSPDLQTIPVVIFSTSANLKDIDECYRYGISGYLAKPMNIQLFNELVEALLKYWFEVVILPDSSLN